MLSMQTLTETAMGTLPNDRLGHGKVRAFKANFNGSSPSVDQPPVAAGLATVDPSGQLALSPIGSTDPDRDALKFRWDINYDGTWNLMPDSHGGMVTTVPDSGTRFVKLQAVDTEGRTHDVLLEIMATEFRDAGSMEPDPGGFQKNTLYWPEAGPKLGDAPGGCGCRQTTGGMWLLAAAIFLARRRR